MESSREKWKVKRKRFVGKSLLRCRQSNVMYESNGFEEAAQRQRHELNNKWGVWIGRSGSSIQNACHTHWSWLSYSDKFSFWIWDIALFFHLHIHAFCLFMSFIKIKVTIISLYFKSSLCQNKRERISKFTTSLSNYMRKSQGTAQERNMIVIQHESKEVYQPTGYWLRRSIQIWEKSAPQGHGKMETHCLSQNSLPSIWIRVDDTARQGKC